MQLIKIEIKKLIYPYLAFLLFALLYSSLIIIPFTTGYQYNYNIEIWEESGELFRMLFPLFAVVPTCWLMYYERKNGFLSYTITRVSKKRYITTKWLVSSIGGALIVFLVSFVGLLITIYYLPEVTPATGNNNALNRYAGDAFVNDPLLYGFLLSLWRGVIGFLVSSFGFALSLYINNIFIVLTGPFVYLILENFVLSVLGFPFFRLVTSFDPNTLDIGAITTERLLVGPILLIILISAYLGYFKKFKNESIY
ncbi:hypothetical protein AWM68_14585 [Fictibacillus phosphorivorans]|uniref:Uncharacterized protein n=1 Tax=Fictibacillus phosphorivorans TaxID=1221500 RepID=A0A163PYE2_9BACL|nr:hypothetical protein [Fictibacillus phosphorivorans]KZE64312.1 hypothetical protein AWM68_14585 [Fictibacillus phosphorivorans]